MTPGNRAARRLCDLLALGMLVCAGGCASFWDEAFSRERDFQRYFNPPNPLVTIAETTDGELRAKALASLREPLQHGGQQADQDKIVEVLTTAARTDRDAYCRLGAIQALGHFKDPRACQTLDDILSSKLPFPPDFENLIRQTSLRSLARIDSDDARRKLILVASSAKPSDDAASRDRQNTQDQRLIAIRAMAKYRQPNVSESLVAILERAQAEKDWAIRDGALFALQESTGKTLPPDPQIWRASLAGQPVNVEQPNIIQRVAAWLK